MSGFNVGDKMWYINLVEDDDDWANGCFPCEVAGFGSGTIKLKFDINNNGVSDAIVSPFPLIPKAMKADHKVRLLNVSLCLFIFGLFFVILICREFCY